MDLPPRVRSLPRGSHEHNVNSVYARRLRWLSVAVLARLLHGLAEGSLAMHRYYYGLDGGPAHTLEDISEKVGLTRERVRQIKDKAITKLRTTTRSKLLKTYLGN